MSRKACSTSFVNVDALNGSGLTIEMIESGLKYTYATLDAIDEKLLSMDSPRLSQIIELTNLSAMVGNLLALGIAKAAAGIYRKNTPHKFPDLISQTAEAKDIEIKVSLGKNKPKGHLPKPGFHLTCRYNMVDEKGKYTKDLPGEIISIWEIRAGWLKQEHFNLSSTAGDSGKTAVVNKEGMEQLRIIFCDIGQCRYAIKSKHFKVYEKLYSHQLYLPRQSFGNHPAE